MKENVGTADCRSLVFQSQPKVNQEAIDSVGQELDNCWTMVSILLSRGNPLKFYTFIFYKPMTNHLLKEAFEKAGVESGKDSVNGRAEYLSEYILDNFRFPISAKSLIRYYKADFFPNQNVKEYLALFLEFASYDCFVLANSPAKENPANQKEVEKKRYVPKKSLVISLICIPLIAISAYVGYINGEEKCMVWEKDHYVAKTCTGSRFERKLNHHLHLNFKKIQVTDTTTFYKNGKVRVWYDKNSNELEFFTAPGIHPENGKTLKPVTEYIIEKHVKNK